MELANQEEDEERTAKYVKASFLAMAGAPWLLIGAILVNATRSPDDMFLHFSGYKSNPLLGAGPPPMKDLTFHFQFTPLLAYSWFITTATNTTAGGGGNPIGPSGVGFADLFGNVDIKFNTGPNMPPGSYNLIVTQIQPLGLPPWIQTAPFTLGSVSSNGGGPPPPPPPPPATGTIGLTAGNASGSSESVQVTANGVPIVLNSGTLTNYNYTTSKVTFVAPLKDGNGRSFTEWFDSSTGLGIFNATYTATLPNGATASTYVIEVFYT
jgi:hypothetical protein